jgi:hypothetical protein
MDELVHRYSFFTHLEPFNLWNKHLNSNVGVTASAPNTPYINKILSDFEQFVIDPEFKKQKLINTRRGTPSDDIAKSQLLVS